MGVRWLIAVLMAAVVAGSAAGATGPAAGSAAFLAGRQSPGGGFAEQGRAPDGTLTAWTALGLVAAGGFPAECASAVEFLHAHPATAGTDADVALQVVALSALGEKIDDATIARLRSHKPGTLVNETIWAIIALRAAREPAPQALVQGLLAAQAKGGGFSWSRNGLPDSNDTAAAIEALRAAGAAPAAVRRALIALALVPEQRWRLRADEGPRVRCAIDGLGDPGAAQRRAAARGRRRSGTSPASAAPMAATATRSGTRRRPCGSPPRCCRRSRGRRFRCAELNEEPGGAARPGSRIVVPAMSELRSEQMIQGEDRPEQRSHRLSSRSWSCWASCSPSIVGMASADSPWLPGDASGVRRPPAIVGDLLAVALAAGLGVLVALIWIHMPRPPRRRPRHPRSSPRRSGRACGPDPSSSVGNHSVFSSSRSPSGFCWATGT